METAIRGVLAALLITLVALAAGRPGLAQGGLASFERDALTIETSDGGRHEIRIELALSTQQQMQGLMFRRSLAQDAGMLFVYDATRPVAMWMKNTLIPLDMLFIAADGEIVKVVERTVPLSLATIASDHPVKGVLELNGGSAARLGIRPGDRVLHPAFRSSP